MIDRLLVLAAVGAGVAFSLVGVAYRLGQNRGVPTTAVFAMMTLAGTVFFGLQVPSDQWRDVPATLVLIGVLGGLSQYIVMLLAAEMLRRGPLTAMWCAVNLGFLVNIVYARVFLAEPILPLHVLAMTAGAACVLAAARSQRPAPLADGPSDLAAARRHGSAAVYALLFVSLLMLNTVYPTGLKHLNARPLEGRLSLVMQRQAYLAIGYPVMLACSAVHTLIRTGPRAWAGWGLSIGALAAVGSVVGSACMAVFTQLPAANGFTTSSAVSILSAAIFGAMLFGERRSRAWYATIAFALAAVGLVALASKAA